MKREPEPGPAVHVLPRSWLRSGLLPVLALSAESRLLLSSETLPLAGTCTLNVMRAVALPARTGQHRVR